MTVTKTNASRLRHLQGKRVFMEDFGCQMNKNDAELVVGRLGRAGWSRAERPEEADVVLYYTCAVREHAEERIYGRLGHLKRLKKERPDLVIGVMGCMAQNQKERIFERAPHVDLVVGTSRFEEIADFLADIEYQDRVVALDQGEVAYERDIHARPVRHQAYVTVMRGCDKFCTFCIVPFTQGRERSRTPEEIEKEVRALVDDGVQQVTLLGQRVNTYGLDLNRGETLATLLQRLESIPGLGRLQFITSHPTHIDETLMRVIRDHPVHSRYLHLPVQSGSDRMLRIMNRGHDVESYRRTMDMVRRIVPDMSLATDWIVGFPGETDEDFQASVRLQKDVGFQTSFVFKYSDRSGTKASRSMPDDVPQAVKEERNQILLAQQRAISEELHRGRVGTEHTILVEGRSKRDASKWFGRTSQNWIVVFSAERDFTGQFVRVRVTDATALTLFAELV
ncbi:MAG TPA: tRNA (N6-isopentenyl adenosine(37)-C2)-methylthiotransferase MiaB [Planctomycetes bacterium]|nr:tRNA (N6-isopentenyl adenosine(37)-C2)-methylthiotransferase MiaB [Planctomycetota bacterium]